MTPEEIGARLVDMIGDGEASVSVGGSYARACVDVPSARWVAAATSARDALGLTFFDWLTGVDAGDAGFEVVAHVWSVPDRHGALLRTIVPRDGASLASLVPVYPGAAWHERETHEMFGIVFDGHPELKKLLLPDEFEGHPLRKDFVLVARVAKPWPGAKEPGESESGAPSRRRIRPPGVPDPNEWGPDAGTLAEEPERPARRTPPGDRPARRTPPGDRPTRPARQEPPAAGSDTPAAAPPAEDPAADRPARPEPPAATPPAAGEDKPVEGGEG